MSDVSLEKIYFLTQIMAGVAVVLSLIYVGRQLKQNSAAMRQNVIQNMIETLRDASANLTHSDEISEHIFTAFMAPAELDGAQKWRSFVIFQNLMRSFELAYIQQLEGSLEEHHWSGYQQYLVDICSTPGLREYWESRSNWFNRDFQEYMNRIVMQSPVSSGFKFGTAAP